jgi:hypothetical protein
VDALKHVFRYLAILTLSLLSIQRAAAQTQQLEFLVPVTGTIEAGAEQSWTFQADSGEPISIKVEATSGEIDPAVTITNSAGMELISNDDFDYPDNQNALLEAITIPRTGIYTVSVSGVNDTAGEYILTVLPGYSQVERSENFNGDLTWETATNNTQLEGADGKLSLVVTGSRQTGLASAPDSDLPQTYYAEVKVNVVSGDNWMVGMTARVDNAGSYYLLTVNSSGQWRFSLHQTEGVRVIRDWTPHPAIATGQTSFSLGMMVNGGGFDFFYNGQTFGQLTDNSLPPEGNIGLAVETPDSTSARVAATFDDLIVTIPTQINDARIVPQELIVSTPGDMAQALQRQGLIPAGGTMALTVAESFVESRRPGIEQLMLGRGTTYQDFALGTTVTWAAQATGTTGCGLILRAVDANNYTLAYVDQGGGAGVAVRAGDSFQPGIFRENAAAAANTHHLLIIVQAEILYYYVDGDYQGTIENPAVNGAVGNAVVNFEPISTSCQFTNTWLWQWDAGG